MQTNSPPLRCVCIGGCGGCALIKPIYICNVSKRKKHKREPRHSVAQFCFPFLTAIESTDCYLHTYHHLCFSTRENIPASRGTFAQRERNIYHAPECPVLGY